MVSKAAAQANIDAQVNLTFLYANGDGVRKDLVLSVAWLTLAAHADNKTAKTVRNVLEARLSREELAQARQLSSAWKMGEPLRRSSK